MSGSTGGDLTVLAATLEITDDDEPSYVLAVNPATIAEAGGLSTVTASTGGVSFPADQTIALGFGGSATKGTDYSVDAESLTLTTGQTSVSTTVRAVDDTVTDPNETIEITATLDGEQIGATQTVTITDETPRKQPNRPPAAVDDQAETAEDTPVLIDVVCERYGSGRRPVARSGGHGAGAWNGDGRGRRLAVRSGAGLQRSGSVYIPRGRQRRGDGGRGGYGCRGAGERCAGGGRQHSESAARGGRPAGHPGSSALFRGC